MKQFWGILFTYWWIVWIAMLIVGDPIAKLLGDKYKVGDRFTDTHFLVTHISMGLRIAILAWMLYHFLVLHKVS